MKKIISLLSVVLFASNVVLAQPKSKKTIDSTRAAFRLKNASNDSIPMAAKPAPKKLNNKVAPQNVQAQKVNASKIKVANDSLLKNQKM